jgi:bacteriocin-like protein
MTSQTKTAAPIESTAPVDQLNETELNQVVGGLLPAVGPAAKPLLPAV